MAVVPNLFGTRDWFCGRPFFHGWGGGGKDGSGSNASDRSGSNASDGSGGNVSDGERWGAADEASFARPPAHLLLCGTVPWPKGWGPLPYGITELGNLCHSFFFSFFINLAKGLLFY